MKWSATTRSVLVLLVALLSGCGREYVVSRLDVQRDGWDTLRVEVAFGGRGVIGGDLEIHPEVTVYLFNAAYDTLYVDTSRVIPLADARLGDRERLMVEVCGRVEVLAVCEQAAVEASPKRLRIEHDISFPEDDAFERGSYDLQFVLERQQFNAETWERINLPQRVQGYLLAYVGGTEEDGVKIPFTRRKGRFSLKGRPHYKDFQFHLESMFVDQREASIHFDVYASLAQQPPFRLASVEKRVLHKTPEERLLEVRYFAEQVATHIFDELGVDRRNRWARVYIDAWDFNALTNTYRIDLEIDWRSGRGLFGRRYELTGLLEVKEEGANGRFLLKDANERAARRWRSSIRGDFLTLGNLEPYEHPLVGDEVTDESTADDPENDRGAGH